jgi:hypothetical protein
MTVVDTARYGAMGTKLRSRDLFDPGHAMRGEAERRFGTCRGSLKEMGAGPALRAAVLGTPLHTRRHGQAGSIGLDKRPAAADGPWLSTLSPPDILEDERRHGTTASAHAPIGLAP